MGRASHGGCQGTLVPHAGLLSPGQGMLWGDAQNGKCSHDIVLTIFADWTALLRLVDRVDTFRHGTVRHHTVDFVAGLTAAPFARRGLGTKLKLAHLVPLPAGPAAASSAFALKTVHAFHMPSNTANTPAVVTPSFLSRCL